MEDRRQGFVELKSSLDAVQDDVKKAAASARENREQIKAVQEAVMAHDTRTAMTGVKVDTVVSAVERIEDKMDGFAVELTATRVHGQDTRTGLIKAHDDIKVIRELVVRHDEKISNSGIPIKAVAIASLVGVMLFAGYHLDKDAMDATVAALKGLF